MDFVGHAGKRLVDALIYVGAPAHAIGGVIVYDGAAAALPLFGMLIVGKISPPMNCRYIWSGDLTGIRS